MRDIPRKILIVTPHLSDAVLGCGELLAAHPGAVVVTAFAGIPADAYVVPEWDAACGFASPRQAVMVRRQEERRALERLDAEPCWLACPESQYRRQVSLDDTVTRLGRAVRRHKPEAIAVPVGLVRGDHTLTAEAALRLTHMRDCQWLLYDDAPQGGASMDLQQRIGELRTEPFQLPPDSYRVYLKRRAAECYESLQRGLERAGRDLRSIVEAPERYWLLLR